MNGFTDAVPTNKTDVVIQSTLVEPEPDPAQQSLFDMFDDVFEEEITPEEPKETVPLCVIYDWQNNEPYELASLKGKACPMGKKFYAVIGNPPYQGKSDSNGRKPPIYHYFMDAAFSVAERVELVTPARFLFDAGQTPKEWNRKMLSDPHFMVARYEADANAVFSNVEIKGGGRRNLQRPERQV